MEFFKFIFGNFWVFIGFILSIYAVGEVAVAIIRAFRK